MPVILLGRLAIDKNHFGEGLGKFILVNLLKRSLDVAINHIGAVALIVDPIDDKAMDYSLKYRFIELPDSGIMFMSMNSIRKAFNHE